MTVGAFGMPRRGLGGIMRTARGHLLVDARTARSLQPPKHSSIQYGRCTRCGTRENVLEFVRK